MGDGFSYPSPVQGDDLACHIGGGGDDLACQGGGFTCGSHPVGRDFLNQGLPFRRIKAAVHVRVDYAAGDGIDLEPVLWPEPG